MVGTFGFRPAKHGAKEKNAALKTFRGSRPDLEAEFERGVRTVLALNEVIEGGRSILVQEIRTSTKPLHGAIGNSSGSVDASQSSCHGVRYRVPLSRGVESGRSCRADLSRTSAFLRTRDDGCSTWARYTVALTWWRRAGNRSSDGQVPFSSRADFREAGAELLAECPGGSLFRGRTVQPSR